MSSDVTGASPAVTGEEPPAEATAPHRKIYPRTLKGRFRTLRTVISAVLQALLFLCPWIPWSGRQAIFFDLPNRRLYLFDWVFWPQETYYVLIIFVFLALTLFVSTAVAGRMWCGYACPQTLFTESFILVERLLEGDYGRRQRLDRAPWDARKITVKLAKYAVWSVMSLWLGITVVAYFHHAPTLVSDLVRMQASAGTWGFVLFFAGVALFDFGYFREQFCHYCCPYARFQGAMFDSDTLQVAYDRRRGEPRGKVSQKEKGAGDCIDCRMCVQVCPMGIDIRNGLQLECIACTACIDACDQAMDRVKRPRGLVRYSSLNALEGQPTQLVRARVLIYAVILMGLAALFLYLLAVRKPIDMDIVRDSTGGVFRITPDGHLANAYVVRLMNKDQRPRTLRFDLEGLPGGELVMPENPVTVEADGMRELRLIVVHHDARPSVRHFYLQAVDTSDASIHLDRESTFIGPGAR